MGRRGEKPPTGTVAAAGERAAAPVGSGRTRDAAMASAAGQAAASRAECPTS